MLAQDRKSSKSEEWRWQAARWILSENAFTIFWGLCERIEHVMMAAEGGRKSMRVIKSSRIYGLKQSLLRKKRKPVNPSVE